jgi:hypothetical protein
MRTVNDELDNWLSKTDEYFESSKKNVKLKHIALYFDDNLLN